MTDTELLDELIHTASQPTIFDMPESQKDLVRAVDGFWRGLILSVGNRRSPFAPDVKICADDLTRSRTNSVICSATGAGSG
jgi:hypothetical protein